ncbi:maestro heat-like repeat-containing protein family member 1 isoform X3 [Oratosquilla oratoria]|uniref:maestro heat-like repeat-containing protein family member 1 isoform X3 n=1 Tax=Oratosquilla oratoria TaxID=337810 RepID=UPI003F758067
MKKRAKLNYENTKKKCLWKITERYIRMDEFIGKEFVKKKGGLVWSLLESASDADGNVRQAIAASLITLGHQHPDLILKAIFNFIQANKPNPSVEVILYNTVENIIKESSSSLSLDVAKLWCQSALEKMMKAEASTDIQEAMSGVLVALSSTHCDSVRFYIVMENVMAHIQNGGVPCNSIIKTLGILATANVSGVVPYMKGILSLFQPLMASIRSDETKIGLCIMLSKFCESISEALASKESDPKISASEVTDECTGIFEIIISQWLKSSNAQVRNELVIALGQLSHLIPQDKLDEQISPIVVQVLGFYRKTSSPYHITMGLGLFIERVLEVSSAEALKPHIDNILNALFSQVCTVPNYIEPYTVKNHYEVLRCYNTLTRHFQDYVLMHLISRLENASYMQRVGALTVTKHLLNSKVLTDTSVVNIVTTLSPIMNDPNSKVVKSLTQVIVALCHQSHLNASNGRPFIVYILRHCSGAHTPQTRRPSLGDSEEESVGEMSRRVMNLLATTVEPAYPILWPHLLEFVMAPDMEGALSTTLGCLAHLAHTPQAKEAPDFYAENPTLPKGPVLLTRLLVLISSLSKGSMGISALTLLQGIATTISPQLQSLWDQNIPQLTQSYREWSNKNGSDASVVQVWQDSLREFLSSTFSAVNKDEFITHVGIAQVEQLNQLEGHPELRSFLVSLIGVTLKASSNKTYVATSLDTIFNSTPHKYVKEREAVAGAVGMCAASHLDTSLTHIDQWLKAADGMKKSLSFFSLRKDNRLDDAVWIRASIVVCLGQIALLAPASEVAARIDGPIMLHLLNILNSNKSEVVNEATLISTSNIARALHKLPGFKLRQRPILLTHIINTITADGVTLHTLALAMQALRDLVALEPELTVEERSIVLQAVLNATIPLEPADEKPEGLVSKSLAQLTSLIRTIIQRDTNPATLDDVTTLLQSWTVSLHDLERLHSMDMLHTALRTYYEHLSFGPEAPTSFNQTCQLLGFVIPRVTDPCQEVRVHAVNCVSMVLKIAGCYQGQPRNYTDGDLDMLKAYCSQKKDNMIMDTVWWWKVVGENIGANDPELLFSSVKSIGKVLSNKLSFIQLRSFITNVVGGLQDLQQQSSAGVTIILNELFFLRGHQLHQHIKEILDSVFNRLEKVNHAQTRKGAVEALTSLASHNLTGVVDIMLDYPLPYESCVCGVWQKIGTDPEMFSSVLTQLIQVLERTQMFTEQPTNTQDTVKIATHIPLTALSAIREMVRDLVKPEETGQECDEEKISRARYIMEKNFPTLCSLLILSYGSYVTVMAPLHQSTSGSKKNSYIPNRGATTLVPTKIVLECLLGVVNVMGYAMFTAAIQAKLCDDNEETKEGFVMTVSCITTLLVLEGTKYVCGVVDYLDANHAYEMQRCAATATFAQLVAEKCGGNYELLEALTRSLMSRLQDKSPLVRTLAVRGLANFAHLHTQKCYFPQWFGVGDKINEVISALVGATDQREVGATVEDQVLLEAMKGIAILLPHLEREIVLEHTPTLLLRIRLFSEKDLGEMREASLGVLKGLASTVGETDEFQEPLKLHLVSCLVHLTDPHPPTVVMCKSALQSLGPIIGSDGMNSMFQNHLIPSGNLNYHQFITDLTKHMVADLSEDLALFLQAASSYFKSSDACLRKAAILLAGNLIYHTQDGKDVSVASVGRSLQYLLRDQDSNVRTAAAIASALLYKHEDLL